MAATTTTPLNPLLAANRLATTLLRGAAPAIGTWQMLPGARVARILARSGADFVVVDCEHGNLADDAMHDAVPAVAAVGASPVVRIPDTHGWMIKRALDAGAHGILVPMLRTVDEARQLVLDAKFPPLGRRGLGSPFAAGAFAGPPVVGADGVVVAAGATPSSDVYAAHANEALLTIVQIETAEALAAVDAIAAVPGIDVLFVGPYDLGNSLGFPVVGDVVPEELRIAIRTVLDAGKRAGKKVGVYAITPEEGAAYGKAGFDMVSVVTDATALAQVAALGVQAARTGAVKRE
jgi:4-hydroxy-2-oxoheptanedioate aldolase